MTDVERMISADMPATAEQVEAPREEGGGIVLSPLEARIVGALIEKALTTPEYYPLTLNALVAACNQKSNRFPVLELDAQSVQQGLYGLQEKRLAECFSGASARVVKYRERLLAFFDLDGAERALLCELLLRGPQTPGELRSRAARMHPFASLEQVLSALESLASHAAQPLVVELPRQPGQKEARFAHLLGDGPPEPENATAEQGFTLTPPAGGSDALEERLAALEAEVAELKTQLLAFKAQFE